jgi:hypothetical protein
VLRRSQDIMLDSLRLLDEEAEAVVVDPPT